MSHTKEPWTLETVGDKCKHFCPAKDGMSILTVALEYNDIDQDPTYFGAVYSQDDARRIVACVNACAGIDNETLDMPGTLADLIKYQEAQRDDLLEALKVLVREYYNNSSRANIINALIKARAAIEKVESGK